MISLVNLKNVKVVQRIQIYLSYECTRLGGSAEKVRVATYTRAAFDFCSGWIDYDGGVCFGHLDDS